jgi:hypothetical protein
MLRVAVVGDHGSGKTTFLGLLYAALVRSGSDKSDQLRFRVNFESLEEITVLFQRLMSGTFPDSATKEGIHGLSIEVGFRKPNRGAFLRLGSRKRTADASTTVHFTLPGSLDEKTPGLFSGGTIGTGPWRDVLDADAVLILVDSTKLVAKGEDDESSPVRPYDRRVESLLTAIRRWRSRDGREVLYPIFVLSKFDAVTPDILRAANIDPAPPEAGKAGPRAAYARALLEPNLPRTLATVEEAGGTRLRFATPTYVFSWVRTEAKTPAASERIRLRRIDGGGWEPDYSRDEYLAVVDALGEIAARTK